MWRPWVLGAPVAHPPAPSPLISEEAIAWSLEDKSCNTKVAKSWKVACDSIRGDGQCSDISQEKQSVGAEQVKFLLDTWNQVSTISESFFRQHI